MFRALTDAERDALTPREGTTGHGCGYCSPFGPCIHGQTHDDAGDPGMWSEFAD